MNLYRSFGNHMEAWISKNDQGSQSELLKHKDDSSHSTDMGSNLLSESFHSGVETASSDMSFPATSCSVCTDNIGSIALDRKADGLTRSSTSPSHFLSSRLLSSLSASCQSLYPTSTQKGSTDLHLKLEKALQRSGSKHLKDHPKSVTMAGGLRRRFRASSDCLTVDSFLKRHSRGSSECLTINNFLSRLTVKEVVSRLSPSSSEHLTVDEVVSRLSPSSSEHLTVDEVVSRQSPSSSEHLTVDEMVSRQSPSSSEHLTVDEGVSLQSPSSSERLTVDDVVSRQSPSSSEHLTVDEVFSRQSPSSSEHLTVDEVVSRQSPSSSEHLTVDEVVSRQSPSSSEHLTVDEGVSLQSPSSSERLTVDDVVSRQSPSSSEHLTVDEVVSRQSPSSSEHLTVDEGVSRQSPSSSEHLTVDEVVSRQSPSSSEHLTVEEVVSRQSPSSSEHFTEDEVVSRKSPTSYLPELHNSKLLRGQSSCSSSMTNPPEHMRLMRRRPMSMISVKQPAWTGLQHRAEEEAEGLSPGLSYLEQVCQMLEDIAQQQMHNRASQMEIHALEDCQDMETDSRADDQGSSSYQRLENKAGAEKSSSYPQHRKGHFRQRSASDTTLSKLHLRDFNSDCRWQHLSTADLMARTGEECKEQDYKVEEANKMSKNWKIKFCSLRGELSPFRYVNSQQMQPSEKNWAHRRLSQLFRRSSRKVPSQ